MTKLRQRMLEDLRIRNYAPATVKCYVRSVAEFAGYFNKPPDQLGPEEIRKWQLYLLNEKRVKQATYIQAMAALRFFYVTTLGMAFMADKIPYPKRPKHLPTVLSQEEVRCLLNATRSLKHKALFMTLYGAGLRVSEACRLILADIDSSRMVIRVQRQRPEGSGCDALPGATGHAPAVLESRPPEALAFSGMRRGLSPDT